MSDDRQPKTKRPAPVSQIAPESTAPVRAIAQAAAAALPEPEVKPALPPPVPEIAPVPEMQRGTDRYFAAYYAALASIGESQVAFASDMTAMALEMSGVARANLTAAGDSVTALLTARSLVDAVEAQLGFARRSIDAFAGGSTRLGEIGLRLASDVAKPVLRPIATA